MTQDELKKARELSERATPGPWGSLDYKVYDNTGVELMNLCNMQNGVYGFANAEFIAESRTLVPKLLDLVEKQDRAIKAMILHFEMEINFMAGKNPKTLLEKVKDILK